MSFICWMFVLSKNDVSLAYPLTSLSYVFVTFSGFYFFGEELSALKILGIAFILFGVILVSKSQAF